MLGSPRTPGGQVQGGDRTTPGALGKAKGSAGETRTSKGEGAEGQTAQFGQRLALESS